jgi:hypothetical protein
VITETRARELRRTQPAPVDLEHGRFEPGQVLKLWGIAAGALGVGSLGGLFISWGSAASSSHWRLVASAGLWLLIFGVLLTVLSYAVALAISLLASRGWWQHQQRVEDWHYAQLAAYEAAGGQESQREVLQRTLSTSEPAHALLVALHIVQQAREGIATPWSSPKLAGGGGLWYNGVRLGDLSKTEAEEFSRLFAEVGLVKGRKKGAAGQLAVTGEAEALQLVAQNWSKYVPGRVDRSELDER